jgi:hypothetical protein
MVGNARYGIRAVAFGGLLCIIGLTLGGWQDVVDLLAASDS